jgi:hypothetical protein
MDTTEDATPTPRQHFEALLQFPQGTQFDICLFWDLFNFLDEPALRTFLEVLRPHLKSGCLAHGFSVHNRKAPQKDHVYGIARMDTLRVRSRPITPPCYAPHSQRELTALLEDFRVERSVLLPDSRLELLLQRHHSTQD